LLGLKLDWKNRYYYNARNEPNTIT
jgi:hypothetical protein